MSGPLLDVRNLSVRFRQGEKETIAVEDVSFALERGRTLALVGESGSGKSVTALSVVRLLGLSGYAAGQVIFQGEDIISASEEHLREIRGAKITMVFQEPMTSLNPLHTIERQIARSSSCMASRMPTSAPASSIYSTRSAFAIPSRG
jgi:microcin C transport system ATP-binding protein